jgi:hypothetical protein
MSIITFILSALLIGFGGYALYSGFDIVTTERGLALTLCGTMALSIGVVVLALGFMMIWLKRISENLILQTENVQDDIDLRDVTPNAVLSSNAAASDSETHVTAQKAIESHPIDSLIDTRPIEPIAAAPSSSLSTSPVATSPVPSSLVPSSLVPSSLVPSSLASRFAPISSSYKSIGAVAAGAGAIAVGASLSAPSFAQEEVDLKSEDANSQDDAQSTPHQEPESAIELPVEEQSSFVDLDKLIDELAVETSAAAQAAPQIETEINQSEVASISAFEAELRSSDLKQDLEQDMNIFEDEIAHILPQEGREKDVKNQDVLNVDEIPDEDSEIIGEYDSGGVTYTLYSNGSVIAQAGEISEKYNSLEALKAALEDGSSAFKA